MHGKGLWVGTDGVTYEGTFVAGKRDGTAKLTLPDGTVRDSVWKDGVEVGAPATAAGSGLSLQLAMDRSKYAQGGEVDQQNDGYPVIRYSGGFEDGLLVVEPDWDEWKIWKEGGPLIGQDMAGEKFDTSVFPAYLEVRLFNPGASIVSIVSAEIEGIESHPDLEPLLSIGDASPDNGGLVCGVSNFKDTKVDSCVISYKIQLMDEEPVHSGYKFRESLPPFEGDARFSIEKGVSSLGIDIVALENEIKRLDAIDPDLDYEEQTKLREQAKGRVIAALGPFGKNASAEGGNLRLSVKIVGEMKTGWTDHLGNPAEHTVTFHFPKVLFNLYLERGAAGPSTGRFDVILPVSGKNYSKPFPYRKTVRAGGMDRFALRVASDGSSKHEFRVRLTSADGTQVVSKPCKLTYLVPAGFSWKNGFVIEEE